MIYVLFPGIWVMFMVVRGNPLIYDYSWAPSLLSSFSFCLSDSFWLFEFCSPTLTKLINYSSWCYKSIPWLPWWELRLFCEVDFPFWETREWKSFFYSCLSTCSFSSSSISYSLLYASLPLWLLFSHYSLSWSWSLNFYLLLSLWIMIGPTYWFLFPLNACAKSSVYFLLIVTTMSGCLC